MFEKLIGNLASALEQKQIPYMLIGGQAVLLYGTPRLTRDIDITLGVDVDRVDSIADVCASLALKILPADPKIFARETHVLPAEDPKTNIRVDFIFSFSPYEQEALSRARIVMLNGQPVKFAAPEDVIVHKMLAGRAVDLEDVKNILIKNRSGLAIDYIEKWLKDFEQIDEGKGALEKFRQLIIES